MNFTTYHITSQYLKLKMAKGLRTKHWRLTTDDCIVIEKCQTLKYTENGIKSSEFVMCRINDVATIAFYVILFKHLRLRIENGIFDIFDCSISASFQLISFYFCHSIWFLMISQETTHWIINWFSFVFFFASFFF